MTDLPDGWAWRTLDELKAGTPRAITDGPFGSNLARRHYTGEGPRVVRLQNIGNGVFRDEHAHIPQEHFEALRQHEVLAGDLLIASLGDELPRACLVPTWLGPAIVKADCIRVRLGDAVDPRWVAYAMQVPATKRWAEAHVHGVGRQRLGLKVIREIPVATPGTVSEQRRILDVLEEHLSCVEAADQNLTITEHRLDVLHKAMFVDLIPSWQPGWETVTVGSAGRVDLGRQRHPDWHHGPEMHPYLRVANVFEDRIDDSDVMEMDFSGVFERFRLVPGDVLLNEGQSPHLVGRPALYRGAPANVAFTNSLLRFRANQDVLPEWALLVFRRHLHAGRFRQEARITTNIGHLSAARLKGIEFPKPSFAEQQRLVRVAKERLLSMAQLITSIDTGHQRGQSLRRAILTAAFSGRLTGRSSDDEIVAELAGPV